MPNGIVRIKPQKPGEQQVVVDLLNQQPLRANTMDRLQQGQQQLFRWDRGPATLRVKPTEVGVKTLQSQGQLEVYLSRSGCGAAPAVSCV